MEQVLDLQHLYSNLAPEKKSIPKIVRIFPLLVISALLAPLISAALIHLFSYLHPVPINLFSTVSFLIISTGITFRILLNFQNKNSVKTEIRNQYGTLLGLFIGLLPIIYALKLTSSTIWVQRFNWLYYSNEDSAAWVSLAKATLQNGHLPQGTPESEYSLYGSAGVLPGVLIRLLASGGSAASHYEAVLMGVDAVLLSYLYAGIATVALIAAFLLVLASSTDRSKKFNFTTSLVLTTSIALASTSLFVAVPIAQGSFLGLSWAIIGTFAAMFFSYLAHDCERKRILTLLLIFLSANFAVSIWPYLVVVFISISFIALVLHSHDQKLTLASRIFPPAALFIGGALGSLKPIAAIRQESTFSSLSSAQGLIIERSQLLILLAIFSWLYLFAFVKDKYDINPAIPSFVVGSAAAASGVTFITRQNGILGEYGIAKLQYIGISIGIIAGLLYFATEIRSFRNSSQSLLLAISIFTAVNLVPQFSAISAWPSSFSAGGIGAPGDAFKRQIREMSELNLSCIPKSDDSRDQAYVCNRWASALSSRNSNFDFQFRAALLNDPRDIKIIIEEFRTKNFFEDRRLIPISEILGPATK